MSLFENDWIPTEKGVTVFGDKWGQKNSSQDMERDTCSVTDIMCYC